MAYEVGQAYVQIMPSAKGIGGKLSSLLSGEAGRAGTEAGSKFSSSFGGVLGSLGKVAVSALAVGTTALTAFGASSVKTGMQFDESMSQVAATMGLTTDQLLEETGSVDLAWGTFTGNLRDYAQELGARTSFSATQASEALNFMALAGYDVQTSMEMLPNVMNLAAAGAMDLGRASDMVTDTQSALGLSIEETGVMVDQMAKTASKSNTSVEQLGDAMLKIGATARDVKGGTRELSTILGVLADNGIKGTEGGTHLRNILLSLQSACEDGTAYFEDIGIAVYDSDGNMRSMIDIVKDMQDELGGLSDESRAALLAGVFNKTDLAAINALLGTSSERFDELAAEIGDCAGAAQDMADTQLDNLAGDITLFKSALEGTQIALSDLATPALREFVQLGSDGLTEITEKLKDGDISGAAMEFGNLLGDGISKAVEHLPSIIEAGGELLSGLMEGITSNKDSIADGIAEVAVSIVDFFASNIGTFISGAIELATGVVTALIDHLPEILVGLGEGIINGMIAILEGLPNALGDIIDSVMNLFGEDFDGLSNEYVEETNQILKQSDRLEEAWDKVKKKKDETINDADAEFGYYQQLADELQTLIDKNGKVKEGEESRYEFITTTLAEGLNLEKSKIDELAEGNSDLAGSIDEVIQKKHAEIILDAEQEAMSEAIKQRADLTSQMVDVENQLSEAEQAYSDYLNSTEANLLRYGAALSGNRDLAEEQIKINADEKSGLSALREEYSELETAVADTYISEKQFAEDYAEFLEGNYEEIGSLHVDYKNANAENIDAMVADAERNYEEQKKNYDLVKDLWDSGQVSDAQMREASRNMTIARNAANELNETQQDIVTSTIANGEGVVSAVDSATGEAITVMDYAGEQFGGKGGQFMIETQTGINDNAWRPVDAVQNAVNQCSNVDISGSNVLGSGIMSGLESGISNAAGRVADLFRSTVRNIIDAGKAEADSHSPSRVTMQLGKWMMEGLGIGISDNTDIPVHAMSDATRDVLDKIQTDVDIETGVAGVLDSVAMASINRANNAFFGAETKNDQTINITNYIDGAENPEAFASRLVNQIRMEMRMA